MKLEVGKKYVDAKGRVVEIIDNFQVGDGQNRYVGLLDGDASLYDGQRFSMTECDSRIVKEHVVPRTKDVWVVWSDSQWEFKTCFSEKSLANVKLDYENEGVTIHTIKKITLTEGQSDE